MGTKRSRTRGSVRRKIMYELVYGNSKSEELIGYFSSEKEAIDHITDFLDKHHYKYPYIRIIHRKEETEIDYGSHHWFYWIKKIKKKNQTKGYISLQKGEDKNGV